MSDRIDICLRHLLLGGALTALTVVCSSLPAAETADEAPTKLAPLAVTASRGLAEDPQRVPQSIDMLSLTGVYTSVTREF